MKDKELQVTSNNPIVNAVEKRINALQKTNSIQFPENYSPQNALIGAMLTLKEIQTRDKQPVLTACSKESIQNSLLTMVAQGLSPAKNQGYFIAYGKKLKFMRSYFGTMAVAKRMADIKDITAELVHKSDVFEFNIVDGKRVITKHTTKLDSIDEDFIAAYCIIIFNNGEKYTEIMTKKQVMVAWSKAKTTNVQKEFPDQMAKRTVINRACKYFINTSDDSDILVKSFNESGGEIEEVITNDDNKQIETHHGKVEMEVEVEPEKKEVRKPEPAKPKPEIKTEKVAERSEPDPEIKKETEVSNEKVKINELMASQKILLEKIQSEFAAGRISQNSLNVLFEKVNGAKVTETCNLVDTQTMLLTWISNLETELKVSPEDAKDYIVKVLACDSLGETEVITKTLSKVK